MIFLEDHAHPHPTANSCSQWLHLLVIPLPSTLRHPVFCVVEATAVVSCPLFICFLRDPDREPDVVNVWSVDLEFRRGENNLFLKGEETVMRISDSRGKLEQVCDRHCSNWRAEDGGWGATATGGGGRQRQEEEQHQGCGQQRGQVLDASISIVNKGNCMLTQLNKL